MSAVRMPLGEPACIRLLLRYLHSRMTREVIRLQGLEWQTLGIHSIMGLEYTPRMEVIFRKL